MSVTFSFASASGNALLSLESAWLLVKGQENERECCAVCTWASCAVMCAEQRRAFAAPPQNAPAEQSSAVVPGLHRPRVSGGV
jgi:hypothetical protein